MPTRNPGRPKPRKPFNVKELENWKIPGTYGEGNGLYFQVRESKNGVLIKSWVFRYRDRGTKKLRDMGIGSFQNYTLKEARETAREQRKLLDHFKDPLREREKQKAEFVEASKKTMPFEEAAKLYWEAHKAGWKTEKEAEVWMNRMKNHVFGAVGKKDVGTIRMADILAVLDPIWRTKTETARRIRGYLENVFDFARGRGYFKGDNPAAWKGNLESQLPEAGKIQKSENQPSLDYRQVGAFMEVVRGSKEISYRALELTILTACRSNEVLGARWEEVNFDDALWTIPAERMKKDREHMVPLSARALAILRELERTKNGPYIFPGGKDGKPLSSAAMLEAIKEMHKKRLKEDGTGWVDPKGERIVPHGFRSSFRDWCAHRGFDRQLAEYALAHKLPDRVESAYQRSTLLEPRRPLMQDWDDYCATPKAAGSNIIPIRTAQ